MTQIQASLQHQFGKHRIVFWYDAKKEMRAEFDALDLPEVKKVELKNNAFGLKYRMLRQEPQQKFLVYHEGPEPAELDNWLLDVQLAHCVFRADQVAIWLQELDLGPEFLDLVQSHIEFFRSDTRRNKLKSMLEKEDTQSDIRLKMLSVISVSEPRFNEILETLLAELAQKKNTRIALIYQCGLNEYLWNQAKRLFDYKSSEPGIEDFALELFKSSYALGLGRGAALSKDAYIFLKRWKDNINYQEAFEALSEEYFTTLSIDQDLHQQDIRNLVEVDVFGKIDAKIIHELVHQVTERTISFLDCVEIIRKRRSSHWFKGYKQFYEVIENGAQFIKLLQEFTLSIASLKDGVEKYSQTWFTLDQLYRKVIFHSKKSGNITVVDELVKSIENHYTNSFLLPLGNAWQEKVDACGAWDASPILLQRHFYEEKILPYLNNRKKIYVIISDGLRYEIAKELVEAICHEDRFEAQIEPMLSMLPSYTQLGMAALLPNQELAIADDGTVTVDGLSATGTPNREKILKKDSTKKTSAMSAEVLSNMVKEECRELVGQNDVVYVYHNHIDAVGDKKESEERVFEAAAETITELVTLVKKFTSGNATNVIITADHGFIYQNRPIEESDFNYAAAAGSKILYQDRRFIIGKGLKPNPGLKTFMAKDLGLVGEMEIQIPKSITRMRLKGSGSRYVHGGASLQEVVIPIININKKRESDTSKVDVDIIRSTSDVITTSQLSVTFYQVDPASDKKHSRKLRLGIYTTEGQLISDSHERDFDIKSEEKRDREFNVRFILTKEANQFNDREVELRMEEHIPNTTHYSVYKSPKKYTIRRSFSSDFDM